MDGDARPPRAVEQQFRTADVARLLGVSADRVRRMVRAGLCRPGRRGRAFAYRFQDLVLLRTAHGLLAAAVPPRRVKRALSELARQLPADRPLSGVRIYADGRRVVVRERDRVWQPESGQLLFAFTVDELARRSRAVATVRPAPSRVAAGESAHQWFERGLMLEDDDPAAARAAYERALELDPGLADAYVNLGRLAHEAGDARTASRRYHEALARDADDPVTHYNLALALEDLDDPDKAVAHYQRAVALNPAFADAHYNLSRLLEHLGRSAQALRHMLAYRRLVKGK